jgi:hypothetical protein
VLVLCLPYFIWPKDHQFIHVFTNDRISFFYYSCEEYPIVCVYRCANIYTPLHTFSLSVHHLMGTWVTSISWRIELQSTRVCKFLYDVWFHFLWKWNIPEVGLLDNTVVLFLIFWETSILLASVVVLIYICMKGFCFLHILTSTLRLSSFVFWTTSLQTGGRWYPFIVLVYILLIISNVEHFLHVPVSHVFVWKTVCLVLLLIFKLGCFSFYYVFCTFSNI